MQMFNTKGGGHACTVKYNFLFQVIFFFPEAADSRNRVSVLCPVTNVNKCECAVMHKL